MTNTEFVKLKASVMQELEESLQISTSPLESCSKELLIQLCNAQTKSVIGANRRLLNILNAATVIPND